MKNIIRDYYTDGFFQQLRVDEFGKPVERTKERYPYSYDGFVTWRGGDNEEANSTVYTDRLIREPYYDELSKKHFGNTGQLFFNREPEVIETFLKDALKNDKVKLILIMEYCNVSTGYSLWRLDFKQ